MTTTVLILAGCGSGLAPSVPSTTTRTPGARKHQSSPGVGPRARVAKVVGPRRLEAGTGRLPGLASAGARPCPTEEGHGEIGIFTDVAQPGCVRVTGSEPVLIVNRTGAYHRSEGHPVIVRLGPYRARLRPQEAIRFAPVGRFLQEGWHRASKGTGGGGVGILVLPQDCAFERSAHGRPRCFAQEKAARRGRAVEARMDAPRCDGAGLTLSKERHSSIGSGGTTYTTFFITNHSRRPCTIAGVPTAVAVDRRGRKVGVGEPVPLLLPGSRGPRPRVRLDRGESARFVVATNDGTPAGPCSFASTHGLRVRIPGVPRSRKFIAFDAGYCPAPEWGLGLRVGRIESQRTRPARR